MTYIINNKDMSIRDIEIEKWNLAPHAFEGATALKGKVSSLIITSGRRNRHVEAQAWATNLKNNKDWIKQLASYTRNLPEIESFEEWLTNNWDNGENVMGNQDAIASKLEEAFNKLTDEQMSMVSNHFEGLAIDVKPDNSINKELLKELPYVNEQQILWEGNHWHIGFI